MNVEYLLKKVIGNELSVREKMCVLSGKIVVEYLKYIEIYNILCF